MVTVVRKPPLMRVVCKGCQALLEYSIADIEDEVITESDGWVVCSSKLIRCPVCKQRTIIQ